MSKATKYIVYQAFAGEEMIIFASTKQHSEVANMLGVTAISAGFININTEVDEYKQEVPTAHAFGESISLGVKSRPEIDSTLANRVLSIGKHF